MQSSSVSKINRMVGMAILIALVIILQVVATFFSIGTTPISLTLIPIIIGTALYGPAAGAVLGAVFGIIVLAFGLTGRDVFTQMLLTLNPFATIALCIVKGAAAGFMAGFVYNLISAVSRNIYIKTLISAIICPVVNTGIFLGGMLLFFEDTVIAFTGTPVLDDAGDVIAIIRTNNILFFALFGLIAVNFVIELITNIVLSPSVVRILNAVKKDMVK